MPSVSSLLRSAEATRKRVRAAQDSLAAFQWESSAQTYEDFRAYSKYLEEQSEKTNDPSDRLSYEVKIRSSRRSFVSNELQRQQMAIMEGRGTTQDKMEAVQELYGQAVDNQDFNLAQNLLAQWDGLSIKLQNEQEAGAKAFASSGRKAKTKLTSDLTKGFEEVTLPTGDKVTPLAAIARDLEATGGSSAHWEAAQDTLEALRGVVIDQYNSADTQDEVDALEQKYGPGLADLDKELFFSVGGKRLTAQQVVNAAANEAMNNPVYSLEAVRNETTGKNEFRLKENNVDRLDYVRQIDEKGEEYYAPISVRTDQNELFFGQSDQGRGLNTQITDTGSVIGGEGQIDLGTGQVERDSSQEIGNRLKELGIIVRDNGTTLAIKLPGESVERTATIEPDGSIRYFADDGQLIEIGTVDRNLGTDAMPKIFRAGEQRAVSPEEISDFGQASAFGGVLSRASAQGERYVKSITGKSRVTGPVLKGPIRVGNDFTGYGGAAMGSSLQGSSAILQSASIVRQKIQQDLARTKMLQAQAKAAERLQASRTFDLNQTPVQQMTKDGILKRQLRVAAPTPQKRIYVKPIKQQKIKNVVNAQPKGKVTVAAPRAQPKLVVR